MHLLYICNVINIIRHFRTSIASLWLVVLSMSFGFMLVHQHEHTHEHADHCHHHSTTDDHADHQHDDCTYCFLYYHQLISQSPTYSWESNPGEFERNVSYSIDLPSEVNIKRYYTNGLRAPPALKNS